MPIGQPRPKMRGQFTLVMPLSPIRRAVASGILPDVESGIRPQGTRVNRSHAAETSRKGREGRNGRAEGREFAFPAGDHS